MSASTEPESAVSAPVKVGNESTTQSSAKSLADFGVRELVWYGAGAPAPNPLRVRIFLSECGLEVGEISLNILAGECWTPAHRTRNRHGQVPTLQITHVDGGVSYLGESVSICRYLDSLYSPQADLFALRTGNPLDGALVDSMIRQLEFRLGAPLRGYWLHAHPLTAKVVPIQFKDYGQSNVAVLNKEYGWVNDELSKHSFIVGNRFTMADVILYSILYFAKAAGLQLPTEYTHIQQYLQTLEARPSTKATGKVIEISKPNQTANGSAL